AKLRAACSVESSSPKNNNNAGCIVKSYDEAIRIASTFDVLTSQHSPLSRKLKLETFGDWKEFLKVALVAKEDAGANDDDNEEEVTIHLEVLLRHCFDIAYKMPPSPCNKAWRQAPQDGRLRSSSVGSHHGGAASGGAAVAGGPPSLQI
ncbi:hypothetical protein ACHAXS_009318, partial [Conticribra weissflogii]